MRAEVSPGAPTAGRVLPPGLLAGFVAAALVLILTFVVGLTSLRNVYDTSDAVARTYAVKADLEGLLSTLVDAETGGRGFVITGDEEFLESYNRARQEITGRVNHAASLLQHSAEQEADLGRVAAAANVKMKNVADAIRLRRLEGFDAARAKTSDKAGKHTMDQLRAIIDRMEAREDTLLAVRVPEADRCYRLASIARAISLGVGLLALAALYLITVRYGKDRMRTTRVLQDQ